VRPIINAFNDRMREIIIPGTYLCLDECMSAWLGMEATIGGQWGMPHVTKIPRKPQGVGCELKSLA